MRIGSFLFVRDEAEEAYLRAKGWKLKDTDHAYRWFHKSLYWETFKVCRSKWDVACYFLTAIFRSIMADIQHLLESKNKIFFVLFVVWVLVCSPIIPRSWTFYKGGSMAKVYAITPTRAEAAYIRYRLAVAGKSVARVAEMVGVGRSVAANVVAGRRHAAKVEKAVAQACGFRDWNTMLRYIRSASAPAGQMLPAA